MKTSIIDLLCVTPIYDRYLCEAIRGEGIDARLASITFHLDRALLDSAGIVRSGGVIDIATGLKLASPPMRRVVKLAEYLANLVVQLIHLWRHKPAVVHLQWLPLLEFTRIELYWLRLLKATGCKVVLTVHNILPHDSGPKCVARFEQAYQLADHLIAHTPLAKKTLVQDFTISPAKISVIPHGPLLHDYRREEREVARANLGIAKDAEVVLFVGTCKPYKGVDFLLKSWNQVVLSNPRARLVIAGNGDNDYLDQIRDLAAQVDAKGSVMLDLRGLSNEEIVAYHVAADVVVLPYSNITQSGALLTAMAFAKAIVATDIAGFRETLQDGVSALLVPWGATDSLAIAISRSLREPGLRDTLGSHALSAVEDHYGWPSIARATVSCYRGVLGNSA